ncbi:MAG: hypothetical protein KDC95_05610 [Planctomycetes bacterium]|nr:hypothetical protein [Planctomycetota bacterium]
MHPRVLPSAGIVVATMLAIASACHGQARLIIDTETTPARRSSDVWAGTEGPMAKLGHSLVFGARTGEYSRHLVTLDPVTQVRSVIDTDFFEVLARSFRVASFGRGRALYAREQSERHELVVTDGTPVGTNVLRNLGVAPLAPIVTVGARALFIDLDAATGTELYVTDGTLMGTTLLVDMFPGPASSNPSFLGVDPTGAYAILIARVADTVIQLARTDGTLSGTTVIKTLEATPTPIAWLDSTRFVFSAKDANGIEPWISDGTAAGTHRLADILPGAGNSHPTTFIRFGTRVLFQASPNPLTRTVYATDGAALTELMSRPSGSSVFEEPVECLGNLYFRGFDLQAGDELFVTDGTKQGTRMLVDLEPGPSSSNPSQLTVSGPNVFFTASGRSSSGLHVLRAATSVVEGLRLDVETPQSLTPVSSSSIAFVALDQRLGRDLYTSDGTASGTVRHAFYGKHGATESGRPRAFASVGVRAIFSASTFRNTHDLWSTDVTERGARLLPSGASNDIDGIASIGGRALYILQTGSKSFDLWSTDGTAVGTRLGIKDVQLSFLHEVRHGAALLHGPAGSLQLTDGTLSGTTWIPPYYSGPTRIVASRENEDGMFAFSTAFALWVSDGSVPGTRKAFAFDTLSIRSVVEIVPFRNGWAFLAEDAVRGTRPYFTDGTNVGTVLLSDVLTGSPGIPVNLCVQDGRVWFGANDRIHGWELWVSDGTPAGTHLALDAVPGFLGIDATRLTAVGTHSIYVHARVHGVGSELHRFDTRTNSIELAADINPGIDSSQCWPSGPYVDTACVAGNELIFAADDGVHGAEPYAFRHGAVASKFGRWCGVGALECDLDPLLGSVVTWRFESRKKTRNHHVLLVGEVDFEGLQIGDGCFLNLEPTGVIPIAAHDSGSWTTTVTVPNDPSLIDVRVGWQVLSLDPATHRFGSSNAVAWTFGR